MNYKKSKEILEKIKEANKIILNCHRGPDPDAIGSALALNYVLMKMNKQISIFCPSEKLYNNVSFLKFYEKIETNIDFSKIDYSKYDLLIVLDSSSWGMVTSDKNITLPDLPIIVIDHHHTNENFGLINLVDQKASSVGELLFRVFEDWKINFDRDTATALLTAIIGDTRFFRYPNSTDKTYHAVQNLLQNKAEKEKIVKNLYRSNDFNLIKFWGEVLNRLEIDEKYKFVYSSIPYDVYENYGKPDNAKDSACDLFAQSTQNTEFGFMALETERDVLSVSFRSRGEFDTSQIAIALGGGGHKAASGAKIIGKTYNEALSLVLRLARKYAKKFKNTS